MTEVIYINSRPITKQDEKDICRLYTVKCLTQREIATKYRTTRHEIRGILKRHGALKEKKPEPTESPIMLRDIKNTAYETFGRSNVIERARSVMDEKFTESHGILYYNGKRVTGMKEWNEIIRDMNKKLKKNGMRQESANPEWVV